MTIPKNKQRNWKLLKQHGDIDVLHKTTGLSRFVISNAINHGSATVEVMNIIDAFYSERKKQIAA